MHTQNDENRQLHVCEACGYEEDGPVSHSLPNGLFVCDTCFRKHLRERDCATRSNTDAPKVNSTPKGQAAPKIGQLIKVRGIWCRIVKLHPFGTLDADSWDGKRSFRVTGLNF